MGEVFTLTLDEDAKCLNCHQGYATPCGFCLACVNKAIRGQPMRTKEGKAYQTRILAGLKASAKRHSKKGTP